MLRTEVTRREPASSARPIACPAASACVVTRIAEGALDAELVTAAVDDGARTVSSMPRACCCSPTLRPATPASRTCPTGAKNFTTVELKSNFLGTTREGTIRSECRAEHLGRTTQVWSATVFGPGDARLALFRCTQLVLW